MLKTKGKGVTLRRGDKGFDAAVQGTSFNARDSGRRPDIVVQANDTGDVIAAINQAREHGLKVTMCSGGHSWVQNHIRDGGLLIDMSRVRSIEINSVKQTATIGPGCHSGDLNAALAKQGVFFPVAHAYTVGMGGFLLQGGFGWNSRVMGLGCENLLGIDVVLADGSLVHASASENADIFWAARGAGPGFFGVVVRYHLKLHARPKFIGLKLQVFRQKHLEDVFSWADRIGPQVSPKVEFQMVFNHRCMGTFSDGIEVYAPVLADSWKEAREAVDFMNKSPVRSKASFTFPLVPLSLDFMMNSGEKTLFWPGVRWYADNMWLDGPIDPLLPALRRIADTQPPHPSHVLWLNWNPPPQREDMAFSVETRTYLALYTAVRKQSDEAKYANWATENMRALSEHSHGIQLADENLALRPAKFMSAANLARLDQIRAQRDPQGLFHAWMGRPDQAPAHPTAS